MFTVGGGVFTVGGGTFTVGGGMFTVGGGGIPGTIFFGAIHIFQV